VHFFVQLHRHTLYQIGPASSRKKRSQNPIQNLRHDFKVAKLREGKAGMKPLSSPCF